MPNILDAEYEKLRTKANSFMNRNWWWVLLAAACAGIVLGLWDPLHLIRK